MMELRPYQRKCVDTVDLSAVVDNAPECIRRLSQWIAWKYVKREGKQTKAPVNPHTGGLADSTDPATWGTFQQALDACRQNPELAGVGFVFTAGDPYCGVDLDNCLDARTGEAKSWAGDIIERLNSYTEISPSGLGVKIFVKATKPGGRCRKAYHDGEIEIYHRERFFTLTGRRFGQSPAEIHARQEQLTELYRAVFGEDSRNVPNLSMPVSPNYGDNGDIAIDDDEIIRLASNQRRTGAKFSALWSGDWSRHFNSPSEADLSLVSVLAFYTKDAAQIDRLFRRSGLMRSKWDERRGEQTYGRMTIAKALSKATKQYKPKGKRSRPPAPPPTKPDLPSILIDDTQLSDLTDQALAALIKANTPPGVFVRAGSIVRVRRDENGVPEIEPFDRARMRCRLAEVANFFTLRKGEAGEYVQVGTNPPLALAENILAQSAWDLPPLAGIARAPILRQDGTICTQPGYDPISRLMYCPDPDLNLAPIPERPNSNEIRTCIGILLDIISDFPFADQASRANALAILFTLIMRPVIAGPVPLAVIDAPVQGTGKTLLATALGMIAVGHVAAESIPARNNDDEWRKKITSILLGAAPLVLLDNIPDNAVIDSPILAAMLTAREWSDRLLGRNDTIRLPSRAVWIATGNNLRLAGDIPRRTYWIRLDANEERPWTRKNFKIPSLERFISANRNELLSAALTVVRAWYANGQPPANVPTLGSFDEWAETVGSVLAFAGIEGFLANLEQTQVVQDEDTQQWIAFFDAWWERFGSKHVTADDLCRLILPRKDMFNEPPDESLLEALPEPFLINKDRGEGSLKRSIGRHLSRLAGRIFHHRKLVDSGRDRLRNARTWGLKPVSTEGGS